MDTHVGVLVRLRHRRHCRHSQVDGFCGPKLRRVAPGTRQDGNRLFFGDRNSRLRRHSERRQTARGNPQEHGPRHCRESELLQRSGRPTATSERLVERRAPPISRGRSDTTRLLVVFSAPRARLGIPVSYFLQALRDDVYDVIVLRDPNDEHYTRGVRGLGSFLDTTRRIEDFAGTRGLQQIITYGASLGGLPSSARRATVEGEPCHQCRRPVSLARGQAGAGRASGRRIRFALPLCTSEPGRTHHGLCAA